MRIDGALKPHQGAFVQGRSPGVNKTTTTQHRYRRCNKYHSNSNDDTNDNVIVGVEMVGYQPKHYRGVVEKYKSTYSKRTINYDNNNNNNNDNSNSNISLINKIVRNSHGNKTTTINFISRNQNLPKVVVDGNRQTPINKPNNNNNTTKSTREKINHTIHKVMKLKRQQHFDKIGTQCDTAVPQALIHSGSRWSFALLVQLCFVLVNPLITFCTKKIRGKCDALATPIMHSIQSCCRLNILCVLLAIICILPHHALADEEGQQPFVVNSFNNAAETTTEFDYATRGEKKFGDKCENTMECGFPGSICDPKKRSCQCTEDLPVTNHIDKCGKEAAVNESCFFNEQCETKYFQTECRDGRCACRFEMTPTWLKDGTIECKGRQENKTPEVYVDWAMIGVLIGMALMFIIICVVLRLFSQARWHENRTIFNTPNPRLMNVSLLRESKLLHGQERRGSRMSVRGPSRQPSMASLRPHSPNPSLGSRSNSNSNNSGTSLRSNSVAPGLIVNNGHHERKGSTYQAQQHMKPHSQQQQTTTISPPVHHHQHLQQQEQNQQQQQSLMTNIISNPVAENVTVEIIEPKK